MVRMCIGRKVAELEMFTLLTAIITRFQVDIIIVTKVFRWSIEMSLEISFESSASSTTTTPTAKTTTRVCQVGWSGGELDVRSNTLLFPEGDLKFTFNKRE